MSDPLTELIDKFGALARTRAAAVELLQEAKGKNGAQFDLSQAVASVDKSLAEIDSRVIAICELGTTINPDVEALLVPQGVINALNKPLSNVLAQYESLRDQLGSIKAAGGGPGALDPTSLIFSSANGRVTVEVASLFQTIWNASENLLAPLHQLLAIVGVEGHADYSSAAKAFAQVVSDMHAQRKELAAITEQANAGLKQVQEALSKANAGHGEIERLKDESDKARKTLAEYESEGTQKITAIRATSEEAEQLRKSVKAYQGSFEDFQTQLEAREKAMLEGTEQQDQLLTSLKKIEQQIQALNAQAEDMLSGATVAGLASAYGNMRSELSGELRFARWAFYAAILFLGASAVPLALYVIPGLNALLPGDVGSASSATDPVELLLQILGRTILLIPAAWLTKFAASRHAALFRLKEHYSYKYSVASSVEGFKKQAEPYKDDIAAATFFELTDNPAVRMESHSHEERHPNPAMEWLMKKMGATHDGR